jgi:leucyl aminopeptidase
MKISFGDTGTPSVGTLVVGVTAERVLSPAAAEIDRETGGQITRAIAAGRFTGKRDQTLAVPAPTGLAFARVLLVGLGKPEEIETNHLEALGGNVVAALNGFGETEAAIAVAGFGPLPVTSAAAAASVAFGAQLRSYRFDKYRTKMKPEQKPTLKKLVIQAGATVAAARRAYGPLEKIAEGVFFTRNLVSEPANVIYPESFTEEAKSLTSLGIEVEVLDEKRMKKLGMGALLGVGQGSVRPPRLVVLSWNGAKDKSAPPVAFIGKGITFDTGGISLKPGAGMEDMKWDMAGAGAVVGLMKALAGRKAKANVVGVVALAENMPDGNAQRPGDIVTSMSGQTIEVLNTDAEGRLVLADALWYVQDRFKPKFMVNLATLTGAIIVALGSEHAGLFCNNDELAERLLASGKKVGESLWRMPLGEAYDRQIDSDAADVKNISNSREAGSVIGAVFLQRFVNGVPWAHLDIAGVAWSKRDTGTVPKGATGYGVRLLDRLVADHYEG